MKNNIRKIFLLIFFFNLYFNFISASEDFIFESKSIELLNSANNIVAKDGVEITSKDGMNISAFLSNYNKTSKILSLEKNVIIKDKPRELSLNSENVIYDKNKEIIISNGKTEILIGDLYVLNGENINLDRNNLNISSQKKATLKDNFNNTLNLDGFNYSIKNKQIQTNQLIFKDNKGNKYVSKKSMVNLDLQKVGSKDIELYFNENGELGKNARLKGSSLISENNKTIINNGIFTTCKQNEKCPPWSLKSKKVIHDIDKKKITYDKSILQLYDIPVFYFPKFFHPDPTVKRQSGFLIPSLINSSKNGTSIRIPYYHVIDEHKDLTITPQFYFNKDFLIQNEFRQKEKYTSHITDFSLKKFEKSSKSHFFSNTKKTLNNDFEFSEIEINLEKTSNDTYLKKSNIKTKTRNSSSQSLLNSYVKFNATGDDYKIFSEMSVFEDLSKSKNSDKYQYIFPNFSISKLIKTQKDINGDLNFKTSGSNRKKDTNVEERYLINDLNYSSNSFFSNFGSVSNFEISLKNTIKNGKNSSSYDENTQTENYSSFAINSSIPLKKISNKFISNLTPKLLLKFNPDKSEKITNLDRKINSTNIFSKNRLGLSDSLEGGSSATIGFDYDLKNLNNEKILGLRLGQIFRDTDETRFPKKSTMQNKSSDLIGLLELNPSENLEFNYEFSADNNLDTMNSSKIDGKLKINNFVTTFEFLEENNNIGTDSYITNDVRYDFDKQNSILFNTRRNRKTDLTEFYNLIYEYKNDCLVAAIEYNKDYYQDRDLKPSEEIFFKITITPFASVNSPNFRK